MATKSKTAKTKVILNRGQGNGGLAFDDIKVKSKTPTTDALSSISLEKIDTTWRRELNRQGQPINCAYAFDQLSQLVAPLGELLGFWQSRIAGYDWTVNVVENAEEAVAQKQKEVLTERLNRIGNMKQAIKHLALARFFGYSSCKVGDTSLAIVDPWSVARDVQWRGSLPPSYDYYLNVAGDYAPDFSKAERISPPDFVLVEADRSIMLALLRLAFAWRTQSDSWDKNLNDASRNQLIVSTPPLASLTVTQKTKLESLLLAISENSSAWLEEVDPANPIKVQRIEPPPALTLYKDRLASIEASMIALVSGSTLNNTVGSTGLGSGVAEVHKDSLSGLVDLDAGLVAEGLDKALTAQTLFDAGLIDDGETPVVYFALVPRKANDARNALELQKLAREAGKEIEEGQLQEMAGLSLQPYTPPQAPQGSFGAGVLSNSKGLSEYLSNAELEAIDARLIKAIEGLAEKALQDKGTPVDEKWIESLQEAIKKLPMDLVDVADIQQALEAEMLKVAGKEIALQTGKTLKGAEKAMGV